MTNETTHHGDAQDKYNIALGLLEPELKKLASYLRKMFPKINSKSLLRILGLFNAWLESKTNNINPVLGSLLKQTVKVIDDAFLDGPNHSDEKDHHQEKATIIEDWTKKVFEDAVEQIHKSDDPEDVAKKIRARIVAIVSVMEEIERVKASHQTATPADHRPEPPPEHSIIDILNHVGSGIAGFFKGLTIPFVVYTLVVILTILIALICVVVVMMGVASNSNHMIFAGGIALLVEIVVVGFVLLPAALGVNIIRAIAQTLRGK